MKKFDTQVHPGFSLVKASSSYQQFQFVEIVIKKRTPLLLIQCVCALAITAWEGKKGENLKLNARRFLLSVGHVLVE